MKFDGIIFDLDGTLWDSRASIAAGWSATLREAFPDAAEVTTQQIASIMGLTERAIADKVFAQYGEDRYRVCRLCMEGEIVYLRRLGASVYDGVRQMLTELSAHTPLFIVSNCQAGYIEAFFDITGFEHFFADYTTEGHTRLKKADNIRLIAERNALKNPVYVGDTALDEQSAREAGCAFIHAAYGFGTAEEPVGSIGAPCELAPLLKSMEDSI